MKRLFFPLRFQTECGMIILECCQAFSACFGKEWFPLAEQIRNYQCPSCTGPLQFDPATGKLVCEYCGSSYSVEEIEKLYGKPEAKPKPGKTEQPEGSPWSEAEAAGLRVYNCPSCGAELIFDVTTTAGSCPYCGNPTIVPDELSGALRPEWVIPFKLTKEEAVKALKAHYKKKPLLPKLFSDQNHLEEIKGVYAPFWLYDGEASGSAVYDAKKERSYTTPRYYVTETSHYECYRSGRLRFERIPVDSSTKMPDEYMDAIEPFDYGEMVPFATTYLPGFMAEKYDVDAEEAQERARVRAERSFADVLKESVTGYSGVSEKECHAEFRRSGLHYALLPVWLLNTKWKDSTYLFAINGQTGKPVGNLPIDKGKKNAWFFGVWAGVAVVVAAVAAFLH